MFSRAAVNPMDDAVSKATDENLTTENWESILSVCDKVDADHEKGAQNAVAAVQKRLGHRNANVQLFSLSLAEALSKNCGSKVHREIASRAFVQSLTRLVNDRTIHTKVKARVAELVKQWSDDFKSDPSLGIMLETHRALVSQGITPAPAPSRPQKKEISDNDRRREEEELQAALALSLQETKLSSRGPIKAASSAQNQVQNNPTQQTPVAHRTAATVSRVRALYDFTATEAGELSFIRGDVIQVIESAYKDWWRGSKNGQVGIFPTNYVENLPEPTPADLQREAEEERRVFAEAKNVEKLLAILSHAQPNDSSIADNDQLQDLYHTTLAMRPKLVRLIEKYSQKKDDLILLNEKFVRARRDYDELMEASLSKYNSQAYNTRPMHDPRAAGYQRPMNSGGRPGGNYARRQYSGDQRAQAQYTADPRLQNGAYTEHAGQQQQRNDMSMGVIQQRAPYPQQSQRPSHGIPPDSYRSSPQDAFQPRSLADPHRAASAGYAPEVPQVSSPRQDGYNASQRLPPAAHIAQQMSGTYPDLEPVTSPSQELSQAFPPAPEALQRRSTYDHERADREGGPPISYYIEPPETAAAAGPAYSDPSIPHEGGGAGGHDHSTEPSAPEYASQQEDDGGFADYYRRRD